MQRQSAERCANILSKPNVTGRSLAATVLILISTALLSVYVNACS
jgi:hypothetical protein